MNLKYWKQFETSGKVEDYLNFVSMEKGETERGEPTGENGHAGIYMGDGNHTETVSDRGV